MPICLRQLMAHILFSKWFRYCSSWLQNVVKFYFNFFLPGSFKHTFSCTSLVQSQVWRLCVMSQAKSWWRNVSVVPPVFFFSCYFHFIFRTQNHLTGDISLPVPNLPELTSKDFKPELLSQNEEVVTKLEEAVKLWNERLGKNLERITSKVRTSLSHPSHLK